MSKSVIHICQHSFTVSARPLLCNEFVVGGCCILICVTCCIGRVVVRTMGVPAGTAAAGCSLTTAVR